MRQKQFPEGIWNYHFGRIPVYFDARLIVISPSAGESNPRDQRYRLKTTSHASQVILQGGTEGDQLGSR